MNLETQIEGLLFYKGEDMTIAEIAKLLSATKEDVEAALGNLANSLSTGALVLIRKDDSVILGIRAELSPLIQSIRKDEVTRDLSKATLETLSVILYKNGVTRSEIDYIRGVNSSFILRNLLVRGLIEKVMDPSDSRRVLYRPTFDTLAYMGVTSIEQIPGYTEVRKQIDQVMNNMTTENDN
ncbi:MAG: SMC-Scp complex subunit ScpB [bacterium]